MFLCLCAKNALDYERPALYNLYVSYVQYNNYNVLVCLDAPYSVNN